MANYSPPVFEASRAPPSGAPTSGSPGSSTGQGPDADVDALDALVIQTLVQRELADPARASPVATPPSSSRRSSRAAGPERILDLLIRVGPYGDAFGEDPDGLTLDVLEQHPHGIDLGPLEPRLPDMLRTPSGRSS